MKGIDLMSRTLRAPDGARALSCRRLLALP